MNEPTPPGKTAGKGMLLLFWIGVLGMLTWFWNGQQERAAFPNRASNAITGTSGEMELVLQRNRQGHYTVQARIQGQPVDFLLDTGATDVVLPGDIAQRLHLPDLGRSQVRTAAGVITVTRTRLAQLDIAGITLENVRAVVNPHMSGTGLLGMSALKQVEFVQRDGRMLLRWAPR